jgi:hypothetical protein
MAGRSDGDDFTRLAGIGQALDRRLHQAGVSGYADLAALTPEKVASLLANGAAISPERIRNEDWIGQAAKFTEQTSGPRASVAKEEVAEEDAATTAGQGAPARSPEEPAPSRGAGRRYESFVVRILLHDVDGRIVSTTVQHVGSGTEHRWPGLDKQGLLEFISSYGSQATAVPLPVPRSGGPGEERSPEQNLPAAQPDGQATQPADTPTPGAEVNASQEAGAGPESPVASAASVTLTRDVRVPSAGEPFTVTITLGLADIDPPLEPRVHFSAVVLARSLNGAPAQLLAEEDGIIGADVPMIKLRCAGLPMGTYRLEALVRLVEPHGGSRDLLASVEGSVLVISGREANPSPQRQLQRIR